MIWTVFLPGLWHSAGLSAPPPTDSAPPEPCEWQQDGPAVPPAPPPGTHTQIKKQKFLLNLLGYVTR